MGFDKEVCTDDVIALKYTMSGVMFICSFLTPEAKRSEEVMPSTMVSSTAILYITITKLYHRTRFINLRLQLQYLSFQILSFSFITSGGQ